MRFFDRLNRFRKARGVSTPDIDAALLLAFSAAFALANRLWGAVFDLLVNRVGLRIALAGLAASLFIMETCRRLSRPVRPWRGRPRVPVTFKALVGEVPAGGFEVSRKGNLLCPTCEKPLRVSESLPHLDSLIFCPEDHVVAVADRPAARLREETGLVIAGQGRPARTRGQAIVRAAVTLAPDEAKEWLWN
jgi:hypothetical protein